MRFITVLSAGWVLAVLGCATEPSPPESVPDSPTPDVPSLAQASNTWVAKTPRPGAFLTGMSSAVLPNSLGQSIVYLLGGTDGEGGTGFGISTYNASTNQWSGLGTSRVNVHNSNGVGVIGNKLYFSGGYDRSAGESFAQSLVWAYNPASDQMIRKADLPKKTADGVTGVINGKLYVLPGTCDGAFWPDPRSCEQERIRQFFRYNPVNNNWVTIRPAPHFHKLGAAGVIGGKFYVAGGLNGSQPVADLDVYDPVTNTWRTLAPMPTAGQAIGTALAAKLYVLSGTNAYVYDPATNTWKAIAKPAWPHDEFVRVVIGGVPHLLAVGGNHGPNFDIPNPVELYRP